MKSIQLTPLTNQTTSRLQNELRTIREIKEMSEHMMSANQPKFHTVIGYISRLRSEDFKSMTYPACNNHNCKKKMTIEIDGFYKCPVCKISFPSCTYRYLLSFDFNDNTGTSTVNGFDEIGLGLFGMTANNLEEISKDQEKFDIVLSQIIKKEFLGTLKVNLDSNNQSVRYTMVKLGQMNYSTGAKLFWDEINYIMGQLC